MMSYAFQVGGGKIADDPNEREFIEIDDDVYAKLSAHQINFFEALDVIEGTVDWLRDMRHGNDRWKAVGYTIGGRALTIVIAYDSIRKSVRPITGWDATDDERSEYLSKARDGE